MIDGAARSRIKRALGTRTQAPGEALELLVSDLVDSIDRQHLKMYQVGAVQPQSRMFRTSRMD
eukprot:9291095-Lingulodinium_polyedra.AAC.1